MPSASAYPSFAIPKEDIFTFLFENKERQYPDDKGKT
jgi:4-coumarate--CoA ligase